AAMDMYSVTNILVGCQAAITSALTIKNQCTLRQASPWFERVVLCRGLDVRPDLHLNNNKISGDP
ncbi:hypothetical protein, partial [Pseudomonas sp. G5(2012)]|uniref:hypothetical protein n=1 Tax=Pseudomonas sp. G5(2012) TaxID=1268068 RepID=UPI001C44DE9A